MIGQNERQAEVVCRFESAENGQKCVNRIVGMPPNAIPSLLFLNRLFLVIGGEGGI